MKNKVILSIIIILLIIILCFVYYVKNIMVVPDKDGMIFETQNKTGMEERYEKGDEL